MVTKSSSIDASSSIVEHDREDPRGNAELSFPSVEAQEQPAADAVNSSLRHENQSHQLWARRVRPILILALAALALQGLHVWHGHEGERLTSTNSGLEEKTSINTVLELGPRFEDKDEPRLRASEPRFSPFFCHNDPDVLKFFEKNSKHWGYKTSLSDLDVWVVSHGGVASEYLYSHLKDRDIHLVPSPKHNLAYLCHLGNPEMVELVYPSDTPILVIIGDFWRALMSMHRRNYLKLNMAKIVFGEERCKMPKYKDYVSKNPNDPAGIKAMIRTYTKLPNVVFLKAPYSKESVMQAAQLLGLDKLQNLSSLFQGFEAHQRQTNNTFIVPELIPIYEPYKELHQLLDNSTIPPVWTSSQLPVELEMYLIKEANVNR
ncbi:expressed unknown protein [Seminavis robusta]|uniref:Uncharacterized protein n=1 Tax=Seminavis robusta TaxID=568900 RepID=A0A9N8EAS8_9STRA|nr:expressed unknown protein [Seminavis robusta]|eukprot:Sro696_g188930.1 n/a (375) ;mRNA; f:31479-32603